DGGDSLRRRRWKSGRWSRDQDRRRRVSSELHRMKTLFMRGFDVYLKDESGNVRLVSDDSPAVMNKIDAAPVMNPPSSPPASPAPEPLNKDALIDGLQNELNSPEAKANPKFTAAIVRKLRELRGESK